SLCRTMGCVPGGGTFGAINQTELRLSRVLTGATRERFVAFVSRPGTAFDGDFFLLPTDAAFPGGIANVRLIDVRLSWERRQGGPARVQGARLEHPGYGLVAVKDPLSGRDVLLQHEVRAPSFQGSFEPAEPFDTSAMAQRWQIADTSLVNKTLLPLE